MFKSKIIIIVLSVLLLVSVGINAYVVNINFKYDKALSDARLRADNLKAENDKLNSEKWFNEGLIREYDIKIAEYEKAMQEATNYINNTQPASAISPDIAPEEFLKALIRILAL
jgi:hypothetical protein